jgi:outer membrane protein
MFRKQPNGRWGWCLGLLLFAANAAAVELDTLPETVADLAGGELPERRPPQFFFGAVGAAAINTGSFLGSDERVTFPFPLLYFNYNDRLYWSIASLGGWLVRSDDRRFKLGLLAKARGGIDADDTAYPGIDDRDPSVDAGINLLWATPVVTFGASWLYDVGSVSEGQSASLRLSRRFRLAPRWSTSVSLVADWMDRKLVDYYYGIDAAETASGAPLYEGRSNVNLRAAWSLGYRLTRNWSLTGGVSYTHLGDALADSPLTRQDGNTLVYVGASWSFLRVHP